MDSIDKRDQINKRLAEDEKRREEAEAIYLKELAKREKIGAINDPTFHEAQQDIVDSYKSRPLTNVNLMDKHEELRKIKSEFENDFLEKQKQNAKELSKLEKQKGVLLKSKSINPEYKPLKEDILIGTVSDRDILFQTMKKQAPSNMTMTKWEKEDLLKESEKYREPENSEDYYNQKYDTQEMYSWSHQVNLEDFLEKVKSDLGDRDFNRLGDLFECYAGAVSPLQMGKIESYQFHLFMKDHDLYTEEMDRLQSDLKFFTANKSKSINFEGFCRILFELARDKYPWEKNRSVSLPYFVRHHIFSKKFYEKEKKFEKVLDEVYSPEVQDLLNDKKKMEIYDRFFDENSKRINFGDYIKDVIDLKITSKLAIDISVVPDLISKTHFVKLFKLVQKDSDAYFKNKQSYNTKSAGSHKHRDYLDKNEFKELIAAVGIHAYTEDESLKARFPKSEQKVESMFKLFKCF